MKTKLKLILKWIYKYLDILFLIVLNKILIQSHEYLSSPSVALRVMTMKHVLVKGAAILYVRFPPFLCTPILRVFTQVIVPESDNKKFLAKFIHVQTMKTMSWMPPD